MTKYIVIDNRETVVLEGMHGRTRVTGKLKPLHRVLELNDKQVELYAEALVEALEAGVLLEPRAQE